MTVISPVVSCARGSRGSSSTETTETTDKYKGKRSQEPLPGSPVASYISFVRGPRARETTGPADTNTPDRNDLRRTT